MLDVLNVAKACAFQAKFWQPLCELCPRVIAFAFAGVVVSILVAFVMSTFRLVSGPKVCALPKENLRSSVLSVRLQAAALFALQQHVHANGSKCALDTTCFMCLLQLQFVP